MEHSVPSLIMTLQVPWSQTKQPKKKMFQKDTNFWGQTSTYLRMDGRMEGRMDGWMDGRTDGWMDGRMDGWMDGRMDGWMDGWMDGRMDGWMDGWTCADFTIHFSSRFSIQLKQPFMNGWLFRVPCIICNSMQQSPTKAFSPGTSNNQFFMFVSVGWWTKPLRMGNGWKSPFPTIFKVDVSGTWRIIPLSKWLGSDDHPHGFQPSHNSTPYRTKTHRGVIHHGYQSFARPPPPFWENHCSSPR